MPIEAGQFALASDVNAALALRLLKDSNLGDLPNAGIARANLGLRGAAVLNVGQTADTVAAGDDPRFNDPVVLADGSTTPRAVSLRFAEYANVLDFGADPTGTDDCRAAFQAASDALPSTGGIIWVPPGAYLFTGGVSLRDGATVRGAGRGASRIVAVTNFPTTSGPQYSFFYNELWAAATLDDGNQGITIESLSFDYSWRTTNNAFSSLQMRCVTRLLIRDCDFLYGGDAIAGRKCEQVWVEDCFAINNPNCPWDFWEGEGTTVLRGLIAMSSATTQGMNFNPEYSPVSSSPLDVTARRLTVMQCSFLFGECAAMVPCQIEPLGNRDNAVDDVAVVGCIFERCYLVCRQQVTNLAIIGNSFSDFPSPSSTSAIIVYPLNGRSPSNVAIIGNNIKDPHTTSGNFGVIWCDADEAVVTGNIITGTGYAAAPFYQGTSTPNHFGNYYEQLGITGRMRQGFIFTNPNDSAQNGRSCIGFEDLSGGLVRYFMAGNFLQGWSTDASGVARQFFSLQARNSESAFTVLVPFSVTSIARFGTEVDVTAIGGTSGTAHQINFQNCQITAGANLAGVRLPNPGGQSVTGAEITVFNDGPNTYNIYPMAGGHFQGGGDNIPDTIAPGVAKTYTALSATVYRIKSVE